MKKNLLLVLCALITFPLMASKPNKEWMFTLTSEGECVVEQTYKTNKSAQEALKAVKSALNRQTFEDRSNIAEEAGVSVTFELSKNTKSAYNPFAGNFQESMRFRLEVRVEGNVVVVSASDFTLINKYQGYGSNTRSESFSAKIDQYEDYKEQIKNGSLKGKNKKEAADFIEDTDESFNQCQKELDAIFTSIKRVL